MQIVIALLCQILTFKLPFGNYGNIFLPHIYQCIIYLLICTYPWPHVDVENAILRANICHEAPQTVGCSITHKHGACPKGIGIQTKHQNKYYSNYTFGSFDGYHCESPQWEPDSDETFYSHGNQKRS